MVARMSRPPSRSVGDSPEPATSQDYPSGLLININYRQEDRSMTTDEKTLGLLPKYTVTRNNDPVGKHDDCKFFVLDPTHDPLAIGARTRQATKHCTVTSFGSSSARVTAPTTASAAALPSGRRCAPTAASTQRRTADGDRQTQRGH
jgi:hypothetical protein